MAKIKESHITLNIPWEDVTLEINIPLLHKSTETIPLPPPQPLSCDKSLFQLETRRSKLFGFVVKPLLQKPIFEKSISHN